MTSSYGGDNKNKNSVNKQEVKANDLVPFTVTPYQVIARVEACSR